MGIMLYILTHLKIGVDYSPTPTYDDVIQKDRVHFRALLSLQKHFERQNINILFINRTYHCSNILSNMLYVHEKLPKNPKNKYILDYSFPEKKDKDEYALFKDTLEKEYNMIFLNPYNLSDLTNNKIKTMLVLKRGGCDIPETTINTLEYQDYMCNKYRQVILKPNSGSKSDGVMLIEKYTVNLERLYFFTLFDEVKYITYDKKERSEMIKSVKSELGTEKKNYIIQSFKSLENDDVLNFFNLRVAVNRCNSDTFNIEIITRFKKNNTLQYNDFISYLSKINAKLTYEYVFNSIVETAIKIFRVTEKHLNQYVAEMGIDLCLSKDGVLYCIEINSKMGKSDNFWGTKPMANITNALEQYMTFINDETLKYDPESFNKKYTIQTSL